MKRCFMSILCFGAIAWQATPDTMSVSGNIEGLPSDYLVIHNSDMEHVDSLKVVDGKFSGTVEYDPLKFLILAIPEKIPGGTRFLHLFNIFPEQGTVYVNGVYGKEKSLTIGGTPLNDTFNKLLQENIGIRNKFGEGRLDEDAEIKRFDETIALFTDCAKNNLDNLLGVFLIQLLFNSDVDESTALMAGLSEQMRQTSMIKEIETQLMRKTIENDTFPGKRPEITQLTPAGEPVSLSEVYAKNKYVLLDFWASWCGPCVAEFPALRKAYADFRGKGFEIYAVSLDDKKELWEKAIGKHEMTWINVSDLKGWRNSAAVEYGVSGIPSNFLIDSNGKIVAHSLRGENLVKKLETLFE